MTSLKAVKSPFDSAVKKSKACSELTGSNAGGSLKARGGAGSRRRTSPRAGTVALLSASCRSWPAARHSKTTVGRTSRRRSKIQGRRSPALRVVDAVYRRVDVEGEIRRVLPTAARGAAAPAASAIRLYGRRAIEELMTVPLVFSVSSKPPSWFTGRRSTSWTGTEPERNAYLAARPFVSSRGEIGLERDVAAALPADPRTFAVSS